MKILVKGALSPYSGYGNDCLGLIKALLAYGADVYVQPAHVDPPLDPEVAALLTRRLEAPFDLMIHHVDPAALELPDATARAAKVKVAWTMWESSTLDNCKHRRTLRSRLRNYDVLFGYDPVTVGAFKPYLPESKLAMLQGGYAAAEWPFQNRDWHSERFGFCMLGQLHIRKDPYLAIQAFQELKEELPEEFEPAELHLKTNILALPPQLEEIIPKLRVHYDSWPTDIVKAFYGQQHCLLAPSRGEGKNLPALEFQSTGGVVIATNWGGHTMWLSSEYAYPLDYELRPVDVDHLQCFQARASKDQLKRLMLEVFRNRTEASRKGEIASKAIPAISDWGVVVDNMFRRLADVLPSPKRELIRDSAAICRPKVSDYGRDGRGPVPV